MMCGAFVRVVVATAIVAALPRPACAECIRLWKDIHDAKRTYPLIFSGTVVDVRPDPDGAFVVFDVDRIWKGSPKRLLVLPLFGTIDGFAFQKDETYLVFAAEHHAVPGDPPSMRVPTTSEPVFDVSQCSPTQVVRAARAAIAQLGRGWTPD